MITVIIVSLNSGKTIGSAISSVLSLDILNLELLVIDGASSDKTLDILTHFEKMVNLGLYGEKK